MFTQISTFPALSETSKNVLSKPTTSSAIDVVVTIRALREGTNNVANREHTMV